MLAVLWAPQHRTKRWRERHWTHPVQVWEASHHWFSYVDGTWVKKNLIKTWELVAFTKHISTMDDNIIFTKVDLHNNKLAFTDRAISPQEGRSLEAEVYGKCTYTNQYLQFDSYHPLKDKLSVLEFEPCRPLEWAFAKTQTSLMWPLSFEKYQRICANILVFYKLGETPR